MPFRKYCQAPNQEKVKSGKDKYGLQKYQPRFVCKRGQPQGIAPTLKLKITPVGVPLVGTHAYQAKQGTRQKGTPMA